MTDEKPEKRLPLSPAVFHILLAIADQDRHGYAIIQEVERRTDGQVRLSSGTLYAAIRRLLDSGMIRETQRRPAPETDDGRRRYYRMTAFGASVVSAETKRMSDLVELALQQDAVSRHFS